MNRFKMVNRNTQMSVLVRQLRQLNNRNKNAENGGHSIAFFTTVIVDLSSDDVQVVQHLVHDLLPLGLLSLPRGRSE